MLSKFLGGRYLLNNLRKKIHIVDINLVFKGVLVTLYTFSMSLHNLFIFLVFHFCVTLPYTFFSALAPFVFKPLMS
jgi:hypothetical protein